MELQNVNQTIVDILVEELRGMDAGDPVIVDDIEHKIPEELGRQSMIDLFKEMDGEFGSYILGRSGHPTRFEIAIPGDKIAEEIKGKDRNTTIIPIPIRHGGRVVRVEIPSDLTRAEATKVSNVIRAIGGTQPVPQVESESQVSRGA